MLSKWSCQYECHDRGRLKAGFSVTAQMQKVLNYISAHGHITDEEVQFLLGIKRTRAFGLMKQMRNMGLVQMAGRGAEKEYLPN